MTHPAVSWLASIDGVRYWLLSLLAALIVLQLEIYHLITGIIPNTNYEPLLVGTGPDAIMTHIAILAYVGFGVFIVSSLASAYEWVTAGDSE